MLSRASHQLSLADIVDAMDRSAIRPSSSLPSNGQPRNGLESRANHNALLEPVWTKIREAEVEILQSFTLQTLAERHRQLEQERAPMYHI